jgi:hypothetical protein
MKNTSDAIESDFVTLTCTDMLAGVTGGNQHQPRGPDGPQAFGPDRHGNGGYWRDRGPGPGCWPSAPRWWPGSWWRPFGWRFWGR